ncbi:MAG TPA: hypothetical protein VL358_13780, partial [Caulobacteraceae bacterium]|nr:hypothetical protein [Caulobacteraceae bacterium]
GSNIFQLHANNGQDVITDFVAGVDKLQFVDQTAGQVTWQASSQYGYGGILVTHGSGSTFLIGATTLSISDLVFSSTTPTG